jgi:Acetyltransferase (GNAT) domain
VEFARLDSRPPDWDTAISCYETKTLFHESRWLDFVRVTHAPCVIAYYKISDRGHRVGYHCHVVKRKCGVQLAGSPLSGGGMFGGPIVDRHIDQHELISALNTALARDGIHLLTMSGEFLQPDVMTALGFKTTVTETHLRPMENGEAKVWATMDGTCRTRIRKAIKSGVTVEPATDSAIAQELFDFYKDALARRGLTPAFDQRYYESLLSYLRPDRVFSLRAKLNGQTIGAGLYLHDDRCMYYWDGASALGALELSPNELLHWTAIQTAIERGIPLFHMAGSPRPSRFTRKFGGNGVPYIVYRRQYLPFADLALLALERARNLRSKILRNWRLRGGISLPDSARHT